MRALLLASLTCVLGACATAPAVKVHAKPEAVAAPAPVLVSKSEPECPTKEPTTTEDASKVLGATVARVCLLGVGEDERLKVYEAVAPRLGQPLDAEAIAADLLVLGRSGFVRDARAIAQPLASGGVVLTWVVDLHPLVGQVSFEGVAHVEVDALRDVALKTAWASPHALRHTSDRLVELYQRRGYALARVEAKAAAPVAGKADVVFTVTEGPLTTVASLRFVGARRVKEAELKKVLRTAVKAPWVEVNAAVDEAAITTLYLDRGMVNARVTASTSPGKAPGELDVRFTITEGDVFTFGALALSGHSLGEQAEVLASLEARPGAVFSRVVLQRDLERLRARGVKQGVRVEVMPNTTVDPEAKRVAVTFEVEKQPGPLKF